MAASVGPAVITVLHVRDCPSVAPLLERLLAAADLAGVSISTTLRVVDSEPEANEIGFAGSPTVLIDGTDPFPVQRSLRRPLGSCSRPAVAAATPRRV